MIDIVNVPSAVETKFNESVSANTDIFTTDLTPKAKTPCIWRVTIAVSVATAVLKVKITRNNISKLLALNENVALASDSLYSFDIPVRDGDKINFQLTADCTIHIMNIDELLGGV